MRADLQAWFEDPLADEGDQGVVVWVVQFGGERLEGEPAEPVQ